MSGPRRDVLGLKGNGKDDIPYYDPRSGPTSVGLKTEKTTKTDTGGRLAERSTSTYSFVAAPRRQAPDETTRLMTETGIEETPRRVPQRDIFGLKDTSPIKDDMSYDHRVRPTTEKTASKKTETEQRRRADSSTYMTARHQSRTNGQSPWPTASRQSPGNIPCFAICFVCCFTLFWFCLTLLIAYLHYLFGFTTDPYEDKLCNYMRVWNFRMLWICAANFILNFRVGCTITSTEEPNQDGCDSVPGVDTSHQQQVNSQETTQSNVSCWKMTLNCVIDVLKCAVALAGFALMVQAFWVTTNTTVKGEEECSEMYAFTHIYSTIVVLLFGIIATCILCGLTVACCCKRQEEPDFVNAHRTTCEMNV